MSARRRWAGAITIVAAFSLASPPARAAACDVTYVGAADGTWALASNWSGDALPTTAQSVCLPFGAGTIVVPAGASAKAKTVTADASLRIEATGSLSLADAASTSAHVSTFVDLTVAGTLASAGSWISVAGDAVVTGKVAGLSAVMHLQSGTLTGTGTIEPAFQAVGGVVEPGGAGVVGTLVFANAYSQTAQATLALDLASDGSSDRLLPSGNAFLDGSIDVHVLGSYAPSPGTVWDFITGSPGVQNLGWTVRPSPFYALNIAHGAQLYLGAPLGNATPTPTATAASSFTPSPTVEPAPAAPPSPTPAPAAGPEFTAHPVSAAPAGPSLLLACGTRRVVLHDVFRRGRRVELSGAADPALAGQAVTIRLDRGKRVAAARVSADGSFSTTAPLPPARDGDRSRYSASVGSLRSLDLKLTRRLILEPPTHAGHTVTLTGTLLPPLASPIATIVVREQVACGDSTIVKRFRPRAGGRFRLSIAAPAGVALAIYRLSTSVRKTLHAPKTFPTDSLPLPVRLN